eukprot:481818_1
MLQSSKHHLPRRHNPLPTTKKRLCPIRLRATTIIIILLLLVTFSFYLSTQIDMLPPNQPYITNNPNSNTSPDTSNIENLPISKQLSNNNQIETALQKSLIMYINRPGHNDRIEYLIGFRGQRITDPLQYQNLQIHPTKKYNRDYRNSPIKINGWSDQPSTETKCDALCTNCRRDCDVLGVRFSMENVNIHENNNHITGNTKLNSLIPVPYFSWHDFQFMLPITPKTANALAAAFISNCGFRKRNQMVKNLQKYGVKVHSYGRCEHNKDEVMNEQGKRGSKIDILQTYKFSLAFENSETNDYITEKFFGSLQSGSVPVYIGAPNVKFFAPDFGILGAAKPWKSKAVIYAADFDFDGKRLAEYLLYLDSNDSAYNEYLNYKIEGYSGDFKAMVELTAATHTNCRQCILGNDWIRYRNGIGIYDEPINIFEPGSDVSNGKWFYIRERGMYRFTLIKIEENTLESLVINVLMAIKPKPVNFWTNNKHPNYDRIGPAVYAIYHIPSKNVIHSDIAIQNLPEYAELEVIFV